MPDQDLPDQADSEEEPDPAELDQSAEAEDFTLYEMPDSVDPEVAAEMAAERRKKGGGGGGGALLGAAMLAIGDILEPEKTTVEIVQHDDDPLGDPDGLLDGVDFGSLPPLDELP